MKKRKLGIISLAVIISFFALITPPVYAYTQNTETLTNGGFESSDISMWSASTCTLARTSAAKKSGIYSMLVTNRTYAYSSPVYDITQILNDCGQGTYTFSTWMKLIASSSPANMSVVISLNCGGQSEQWFTGNTVSVTSSSFIQSIDTNQTITWTGSLTYACLYIYNPDNALTSFYIDNFSFVKTSTIIPGPTYISTAQSLALRDAGSPQIGAIRWDAWLPKTNLVGAEVARTLGPNQFHFRLPYFALSGGDNNVDYPEYTQAQMDAEINYAAYAGIDYWAYCWYPTGDGMATARNLHVSSSIRDKVKMCAILGGALTDSDRAQLVGYFKENFYMKVQNGRPLLYFFSGSNNILTIIYIQQDCLAQGIPMPYIVNMNGVAGTGFDAVSNYAIGGSGGVPFSTLAASAATNWNTQKNAGNEIIPCISTGWDPRPRINTALNPLCIWKSYYTDDGWVQTATASEIAAHVQNAITWVNNNTSARRHCNLGSKHMDTYDRNN